MAYLKNWTDNFFQIFVMGTSWVAVLINNITTRASREMTSRNISKIFYFNGVNVAKHWHVAGEVFASSDCLVIECMVHMCVYNSMLLRIGYDQLVITLFFYLCLLLSFGNLSVCMYVSIHSLNKLIELLFIII